MPQVRHSVPGPKKMGDPDFLWSLSALADFMRLSLMKAAHADLFGAMYRKSGKALPKVFNVRFKRASLGGQNPDHGSVIPHVKAFENTIFGPRTLVRTWGTRPIPSDFAMTHTPSESLTVTAASEAQGCGRDPDLGVLKSIFRATLFDQST